MRRAYAVVGIMGAALLVPGAEFGGVGLHDGLPTAELQYPAMSIDDAVTHARERREVLMQQEQEAVRRIGACLDEFLAKLAAINDTTYGDRSIQA